MRFVRLVKRGFTLVEIVVAVAIVAIIVSVMAAFLVYYFGSYRFSFEGLATVGQAQGGLKRMIRELREARIADNGAWPIVEAIDNSLIFYADVTDDGKVDRVRYFLESEKLKRGVIEPSGSPTSYLSVNEKLAVIADNVVNSASEPLFGYFNGDWPVDKTTNPISNNRISSTRYVKVHVKIDLGSVGGAGAFDLISGVMIRSLKTNL